MKNIILLIALLISSYSFSDNSDKKSLMLEQYQMVKRHLESKQPHNQAIVDSAKIAFDIALEINEDHETISTLGSFYLQVMDTRFNHDDQERVLLKLYEIDQGTPYFNDTALNLINYYMRNFKHQKAMEISEVILEQNIVSVKEQADLNLRIGSEFFINNHGKKELALLAKKYIEKSIELYQAANDPDISIAQFWLGKYYAAMGDFEKAVLPFELAIDSFTLQPEQSKIKQIAESFLLKALIKTGEEEKTNAMCQKIGKERPWDDGKDVEPLYIEQPIYPRDAAMAGKEAWIRYKMKVDINGYPKDIEVIDTSELKNIYRRGFEKAGKDAIKNWRFAPKFENGIAIESEAYYTLEFRLAI